MRHFSVQNAACFYFVVCKSNFIQDFGEDYRSNEQKLESILKNLKQFRLIYRIEATDFKVIVQNDEQIELSFSRTYNSSSGDDVVPLNVDKR